MKIIKHLTFQILSGLVIVLCLIPVVFGQKSKKTRIFIVSSYHREYLWSQETNEGVCGALLEFGYLDNKSQIKEFTKNDYAETSNAIVKKSWMDTKQKSNKDEMVKSAARIVKEIKKFNPDTLLLGDDNAANYIGNQFIDTKIPIFIWGVNVTPVKYGLVDSIEKPGHNVTGTYQAGYYTESLEFLKKIVPGIKTFAVLSDDSETGRSHLKRIQQLAEEGKLPVKLVETVATNSYSKWKSKALELQKKVDAFFTVNHSTIKDVSGNPVDEFEIGAWYLRNIKKPECTHQKSFVVEGMLCAADDSGFKQGYAAVKSMYEVLEKGKDPATLPCRAIERGPLVVNRQRAQMLGIKLTEKPGIEEYIDKCLALEKHPESK
ncbi:MAG: ABC transporter substrate binding protein [Elusimicrobiota bacterium]